MNRVEVLELVRNVNKKKQSLKALQEYMSEERLALIGLKAVAYDKVTVVSSHGNSSEAMIMKYLERMEELEQRYTRILEEMMAEEDLLAELMTKLKPKEYEAVLNRYLRGCSEIETAHIMHYSVDGIKKLCTKAIKKMAQ